VNSDFKWPTMLYNRPVEITATISFDTGLASPVELKAIRQGSFQTLYEVVCRFVTDKETLKNIKSIKDKYPRITRAERMGLGYTEVDVSWEAEMEIGECQEAQT